MNTLLVVRRRWQKPTEEDDDRKTAERRKTKPVDARSRSTAARPGNRSEEQGGSGSNETAGETKNTAEAKPSKDLVKGTRGELRTEPGGSGGGTPPPPPPPPPPKGGGGGGGPPPPPPPSPTKGDEAGL